MTGASALMLAGHPPGAGSGSAVRGATTLGALRERFERVDVRALAFDDEHPFADRAAGLIARPRRPTRAEQLAWIARGGAFYWDEHASGIERHLRAECDAGGLLARYDLVWVASPLLARAAQALGARGRVLDIDNVPSAHLRSILAGEWASAPLDAYRRLLVRALQREERRRANLHDAVTVTSAQERALLGAVRPPVFVVPNTVAAVAAAPVAASGPEALFVGSLSYEPNIDALTWLLDEIWPLISERVAAARLRIVGRNPGDALRRRCAKTPGVTLIADAPSLDEHYHAARVVLAPLRGGGGTGRIKILEALAYGVPIVASAQALEGVDVEPARDAIVADGAEPFAAGAATLLRDAAAAAAIGAAGRALWERAHAPAAAQAIIGGVLDGVLGQ